MNNFILENIAGFVKFGKWDYEGVREGEWWANMELHGSGYDSYITVSGAKEAEELAASLITFANFCREKGIE